MPVLADVVEISPDSPLITRYVEETGKNPEIAVVVPTDVGCNIIRGGRISSLGQDISNASNAFVLDGGKGTYALSNRGVIRPVEPTIAGVFTPDDVIDINGSDVSVRQKGKPPYITGDNAIKYLAGKGICILNSEFAPVEIKPDHAATIADEYGLDVVR